MKKLIFDRNLGKKKGGREERPRMKRRLRSVLAGAALISLLGCCGGNNDNDHDAGNSNDAQVCLTPGIGSEHKGSSVDHPMEALAVTQQVTPYYTPIDCVDHLSAEETVFVQPDSTRMLPNDDLTRGKLAIYRNVVTLLGNEYNLFVYRDFDGARLQKHDLDSFEVEKVFNIPSPEGDITWQVRAINQTTETVAGRDVMKVTFEVLNSPDRTPEQTQKDVYIVTDPADYVPVYDAVTPTGARVNQFTLTARNLSPTELESVRGKIWVDPNTLALSVATETFSFDVEGCGSACGNLPYADSGREVTLQGIGVVVNEGRLVGFTFSTGFFELP